MKNGGAGCKKEDNTGQRTFKMEGMEEGAEVLGAAGQAAGYAQLAALHSNYIHRIWGSNLCASSYQLQLRSNFLSSSVSQFPQL